VDSAHSGMLVGAMSREAGLEGVFECLEPRHGGVPW
jgi:hypothetical protein